MQPDTIHIEQTFPVSSRQVWQAITDPAQMKQWYFPMMEDFRPEPGFTTQFDVVMEDKRYPHFWKVTAVEPGKKISYEWRYGGYPGNSLLTMELFPEGTATRLVLTHEKLDSFRPGLHPELAKENFILGWTNFIQKALVAYLEEQPAVK